jgi:hypothetical protein
MMSLRQTLSKRKLEKSDECEQERPVRCAEAGKGWRELFFSETSSDAGSTQSAAESVADGHSVLILPDLASVEECDALLAEAIHLAGHVRKEHFGEGSEDEDETEQEKDSTAILPPAHCLMLSNASRIRMPVTSMFSDDGQRVCDAMLLRALTLVETEIPELSKSLFGACLKAPTCLGNERLVFAAGEPAVNLNTHTHTHRCVCVCMRVCVCVCVYVCVFCILKVTS